MLLSRMFRPATERNTNWRSEWLSPPHQELPPSDGSRSCTHTHGRFSDVAVGVPVTWPLSSICRPGGRLPLTISHLYRSQPSCARSWMLYGCPTCAFGHTSSG